MVEVICDQLEANHVKRGHGRQKWARRCQCCCGLRDNQHDGLIRQVFIQFGSNSVLRSLVSLWIESKCLRRQDNFSTYQPNQPKPTNSKNFQLLFLGNSPHRGRWLMVYHILGMFCYYFFFSFCLLPPPQGLLADSEALPAGSEMLLAGFGALPAGSEAHPALSETLPAPPEALHAIPMARAALHLRMMLAELLD